MTGQPWPEPRTLGSGASRASYVAYRAAAVVAQVLPRPAAELTAHSIGRALAALMHDRRTMVERHLRRVDPSLRGWRLRRAVLDAFDSYAQYWLEVFRLPRETPRSIEARFGHEGYEHIEAAAAAGRGYILALPHLGSWDLAGAWLAGRGHRAVVVAEAVDPPELFEWFVGRRQAVGMQVVAAGPEAGPAVLAALRAGRPVALVADRDILGTGIEVDFFGERTTLPAGPAALALRTGAPLLPVAVYLRGRHRHHAVVRPPLPARRTGRFRDDCERVTQALARELEDLIRAAPEQWHLFQPNWPSDFEALGIGRRLPREPGGVRSA